MITSGANRVNEACLAEISGEPVLKADADFVRTQAGYAIGGVPPVGHAQPLAVFIDEDLLQLRDHLGGRRNAPGGLPPDAAGAAEDHRRHGWSA
ncbi:MAG: hypothetical protein MZV70_60525 [Desulfobacterales bacterium]|nr:hypothetical protein [Desulfobacterales bacterium]